VSCLALCHTRLVLGERSPLGRAAALLARCPPPTTSNLDLLLCGADRHPSSPFALSGSSVGQRGISSSTCKREPLAVSNARAARPCLHAGLRRRSAVFIALTPFVSFPVVKSPPPRKKTGGSCVLKGRELLTPEKSWVPMGPGAPSPGWIQSGMAIFGTGFSNLGAKTCAKLVPRNIFSAKLFRVCTELYLHCAEISTPSLECWASRVPPPSLQPNPRRQAQ
jgi:hypothetical protein